MLGVGWRLSCRADAGMLFIICATTLTLLSLLLPKQYWANWEDEGE